MADFDVQFFSGTASPPWVEDSAPNRGVIPSRYRRVARPAASATFDVILKCIVGGVVAPIDAALGGRLFTTTITQFGGTFPPGLVATAGHSSLITVRVSHESFGHQELCVRRPGGGTITLSFEVE